MTSEGSISDPGCGSCLRLPFGRGPGLIGSWICGASMPRLISTGISSCSDPTREVSYWRAAMRSWVSTASLPMREAMSWGEHDHCVPIAAPSADTETTANDRSWPSRASLRCSWRRSIRDAAVSSTGALVTARRATTVAWVLCAFSLISLAPLTSARRFSA